MIQASCHCGGVQVEVASAPETVARCNCSICSRIGGLWAYYHPRDVRLVTGRDAIDTYTWGDRTIRICRCNTCGCTTHWESIDPSMTDRMGINARMMTGINLERIPVRQIDGAAF